MGFVLDDFDRAIINLTAGRWPYALLDHCPMNLAWRKGLSGVG